MTSTTADAAAVPQQDASAAQVQLPLWLLIGAALLLGLALSFPRVVAVWQTGAFFDSDDAMRLVEVRQLLAGQHWFDMTIYRLDPPAGVFMHWSRDVDVPLAVLIKLFATAMPIEYAERAARLAFPLILQALLYLGIARLARILIGSAAVLPAILLTLLSGIAFGQFQPGRIDHHAPQIVLLIFMTGNCVAALDPRHARAAAWAGLLAALSLSISIETLPFIFALAGLLVLLWVIYGKEAAAPLLPFGLALAAGLVVTFVATIGPAHWLDRACDAFSFAYLVPGLAGAGVVAALGLFARMFAPAEAGLRSRSALLMLAGGLVVALAFAATKPVCLRDPFIGIDPLLRELWLDRVAEAMPLTRLFAREPTSALAFMLPIVLGLGAAMLAAARTAGLAQRRWILVAALSAAGAAMCFWMIRVVGFAAPLALVGGAWAVNAFGSVLARSPRPRLAGLALLLALPFSSLGWTLVLAPLASAKEKSGACLAPAAITSLRNLPPGLVAAPIDAGSYILAFTRHEVLAAPYHRDNHGNLVMLDAFMAEPHRAAALLRDNGVAYVALCPGLGETADLAARAPDGLAAALRAGQVPDFLTSVLPKDGERESLYRVFKVKIR